MLKWLNVKSFSFFFNWIEHCIWKLDLLQREIMCAYNYPLKYIHRGAWIKTATWLSITHSAACHQEPQLLLVSVSKPSSNVHEVCLEASVTFKVTDCTVHGVWGAGADGERPRRSRVSHEARWLASCWPRARPVTSGHVSCQPAESANASHNK